MTLKDVKVNDWLQVTGLKIQVKHCDHIFRVYFKSLGADTVCRVEESCTPRKPVIQAVTQILNPSDRIEQRLDRVEQAIRKLSTSVEAISDGD